MNRHLLLISNPGNPQDENYSPATKDALDRWEVFFRSPIGGYWQDEEITRFGEERSIDPDSLRRLMIPLNTVQCQYSIIVFCGHGCCTTDGKEAIQLPIPDAKNHQLLPTDELLAVGLSHVRRTVILDACRSLIPFSSSQLFEQRQYSSIYSIDGDECRKYYDYLIMQASPHVEILYSTSDHHKAYGTLNGSLYADTMSNLVRQKVSIWKVHAINDPNGFFCYTMRDLHNDLTSALAVNNIQKPDYEVRGRASASFPFAAMHLPTDRTIYNDNAIVEVIED